MFFYDFVNTCKMNKGVVNGMRPIVFNCDSGRDFGVKLHLFAVLITLISGVKLHLFAVLITLISGVK